MEVNAYFDSVVLFGVPYRLDVKTGEKFTLVMDKPEEATNVFADNDPILDWKRNGSDIDIEAKQPGRSLLWIVNGKTIIRELEINIVDSISRPAADLGVKAGQPELK